LLKLKTLILLFLISLTPLQAQVTTEGTDFWFGFMHNDAAAFIEIYVSSREQASVTVNTPAFGWSTSVNVSPNTTTLINVPLSLMPTTEGIQNMGIHLTSDVPVTVYTLNKRQFSADAAVILPTNVLGQEYYVMAHMEPPGDRQAGSLESEFLIVASEDDTQVEVILSVRSFNGFAPNTPHLIELNAGETYQFKSNEDLTGSFVRNISPVDPTLSTCKKIAVFGGNRFTNVGGCGGNRDHLIEQMFPIPTWGKKFLFVPYETRSGGDYLKIIASEDNTEVDISGIFGFTLNKGELYVNKALDGVRTINTSKPVQIAQFSRSTQCDNADGDPFMIMLSPLEQRVNQVTFDAFDVTEIDQYYLTLITGSDDITNIEIDGVDVSSSFITVLGGGAYANFEINQGTHTVTAPNGVIAYVYGFGSNESFGYSAGVSLVNLNLMVQGEDEQIGIIVDEGCVNSEIFYDAVFDTPAGEQPRFDTFSWGFGDGTTAETKEAIHIYSEPGTYTVSLTASSGTGACSSFEVITRDIVITGITFDDPIGPSSVCPDVMGIAYSVTGDIGNTYEWSVFGGVIDGDNTSSNILIDWGGVSLDSAWVKLVVKNSIGCAADTFQIDVRINNRLEPIEPQGDKEVCFLDISSVPYSTPPTNGSVYEWFVEGGSFVAGNTGADVAVNWAGAGAWKLWYTEENPLIPECKGTSDTTFVTVYTEILPIETITDALCFEDSNGTIDLSVSGGKGNHTVLWSNGSTDFSISGLSAATYQAIITDELGCEIIRDYIVGEPDLLELVNPVILDVRCFQEANGEISLDVVGGTAPYSYHFTGVGGLSRNITTNAISALVTGDYAVEVTDANGCTQTMDFFVSEPALLEPDLATLINIPICPQASDGIASINGTGGTPAYQFFWSTAPPQVGIEATGLSRGIYNVRIVDANGCEAFLDVEVTERFPRVSIPTAFSPNGDGENDKFAVVTDCTLVFTMQIFNQWGSIIFSTSDINEGWDGTFKGSAVQDGMYSYKVFYTGSINGVPFAETIRGTTRIFR